MNRRIIAKRFVALTALLGLYHAWDWMPLRTMQRDLIGWSLRVSGYTSTSFVYDGSPALGVEDKIHYYSPECTYLDLFLMVVPFVWVLGVKRRNNVLRISIAVLVISGGNLIRCWAAVYLDVVGVERFYAHDLPDYIIWWPTVIIVALLALRRDFGDRFGSQRRHTVAASTGLRTGDVCT